MAERRAELKAIIGAKTSAFGSAMKRVGRLAKGMGKTIGKVMGVGGVGAIAVGYFTKKLINAADEMEKLERETGISVETLKAYEHVANMSGTNTKQMAKAVTALQRRIVKAGQGLKTYTRALDEIGLSYEDLRGLSPTDQFELVMTQMSEMENVTKRNAAAMELFSRTTGQKMLRVLDSGAGAFRGLVKEGREFNTLTGDTSKKAAAFNDALTRLKAALEGVLNKTLLRYGVELRDVIDGIREKIMKMRKNEKFIDIFRDVALVGNNIASAMRKAFVYIQRGAKLLKTDWQSIMKALSNTAGAMGSRIAASISEATGLLGYFKTKNLKKKADALQNLAAAQFQYANQQSDLVPISEKLEKIESDKAAATQKIKDIHDDAQFAARAESLLKTHKELVKQIEKEKDKTKEQKTIFDDFPEFSDLQPDPDAADRWRKIGKETEKTKTETEKAADAAERYENAMERAIAQSKSEDIAEGFRMLREEAQQLLKNKSLERIGESIKEVEDPGGMHTSDPDVKAAARKFGPERLRSMMQRLLRGGEKSKQQPGSPQRKFENQQLKYLKTISKKVDKMAGLTGN